MSMPMDNQHERPSFEIADQGIADSGIPSISVRVRRGLPDFLSSVNLNYVKLGYCYLVSHGIYFVAPPLLLVILSGVIGKLALDDFSFERDLSNSLFLLALMAFLLYVFLDSMPRPTYLLDFACFRPPSELKISKEEFIDLARKSGKFNDEAIEFQRRALQDSGIGDETYLPRAVFRPGYEANLRDGREEAAMVMFGAVDDLLAATGVRPKDIGILIVNCGILNTTPSLSAMLINHYKLRHDINSFNLGGMGCAAGIIAIDLARDLLSAWPGTYALVVSTEVVSFAWYGGDELDMLLPNCFFRMGAAAVLLSSRRLDWWRAKYQLKQLVRTHKGMDDRSFKSIHQKEDGQGKKGLGVSKDIVEVGSEALKANISALGPLVLPLSEQLNFFTSLLFSRTSKPYIPNHKLAFQHVCILATSKRVLDQVQTNLELTGDYMEASRRTLERFGNTSSSSVWYELAYLEAIGRIQRGDQVWQIAYGSGFKCNSVVWKAARTIGMPKRSPWCED